MLDWIKEEAITLYGLIVVGIVFFTGAIMGQFFGNIGDWLFGKKKN